MAKAWSDYTTSSVSHSRREVATQTVANVTKPNTTDQRIKEETQQCWKKLLLLQTAELNPILQNFLSNYQRSLQDESAVPAWLRDQRRARHPGHLILGRNGIVQQLPELHGWAYTQRAIWTPFEHLPHIPYRTADNNINNNNTYRVVWPQHVCFSKESIVILPKLHTLVAPNLVDYLTKTSNLVIYCDYPEALAPCLKNAPLSTIINEAIGLSEVKLPRSFIKTYLIQSNGRTRSDKQPGHGPI